MLGSFASRENTALKLPKLFGRFFPPPISRNVTSRLLFDKQKYKAFVLPYIIYIALAYSAAQLFLFGQGGGSLMHSLVFPFLDLRLDGFHNLVETCEWSQDFLQLLHFASLPSTYSDDLFYLYQMVEIAQGHHNPIVPTAYDLVSYNFDEDVLSCRIKIDDSLLQGANPTQGFSHDKAQIVDWSQG
jgi:hypothetical protein